MNRAGITRIKISSNVVHAIGNGMRGVLVLTGLLWFNSLHAQSAAVFPRPPEIEPAINFWVRVYTEVDTQSGFLHDSQNLSVIYEALPLDQDLIEETRDRIQEDLNALASGKRNNLSNQQRRILELWPAGVSNDTLREAVANVRWQLGQSDRFLGGLERSGAYRQHINDVIREKQLPLELVVLPHVESSFNPSAYSHAAAAGMWQFTRATGQRFMRIDNIVDERMDPYISASAAMSLLEYNYRALGTWPLALTAYNHGTAGMARAARETGTTDIETIIQQYKGRAFGFASRNFYAQFLAVLQVENDARKYFGDVRLHPAPNFIEVKTDAFIDADAFARSIGVSLEQLKADNPALRPAVWEGNKRIPEGFPLKLRAESVSAGNVLAMVPTQYKYAQQTPDVAYVVVSGDSLSVIARRFKTSVAKLVELNQLPGSNRLQIGQRLLLPQDQNSPVQIAAAAAAPVTATAASNAAITPDNDGIYTVRRGDTISLIAQRQGVSERALLASSGITDPHRIYPGQRIALPAMNSTAQQGAINGTAQPVPPAQVAAAGAETLNTSTPEQAQSLSLALAETQTNPAASGAQLGLATDLLLPAAVVSAAELPDAELTDTEANETGEEAVALDPAVDVLAKDEQIRESLAADPADYSVDSNASILIQPSETLSHYADWLGLLAADVRRLNHMALKDPVIIGERLRMDFSKVNAAEFELKRREYHAKEQQNFFSSYRIQGVEEYRFRRNDNIGTIARNRYATPIWLLHQYNPELEFDRIQIGQPIIFPLLEAVN